MQKPNLDQLQDHASGTNFAVATWKEGDRSEAVCPHCKRLVATRFEIRSYLLQESGTEVPELLVAVCAVCGGIAAIPAQSTPILKEASLRGPKPPEAQERTL